MRNKAVIREEAFRWESPAGAFSPGYIFARKNASYKGAQERRPEDPVLHIRAPLLLSYWGGFRMKFMPNKIILNICI
jgi:hypothetical protein